jgi:hypothetical protein
MTENAHDQTRCPYQGDENIKIAILAEIAKYREAGKLIQCGKPISGTFHGADDAEYETRFGIPKILARLYKDILSQLPVEPAHQAPSTWATQNPVRLQGASSSRPVFLAC